jgi:hypothetical protein
MLGRSWNWDWSLHTVNPSVTKLVLNHNSPQPNVTQIFYTFPALKSLSEINQSRLNNDRDGVVVNLNHAARIEFFESRHLPPVQFLRSVKHMVLHSHESTTIDRLIRFEPQLTALRKLDFVVDVRQSQDNLYLDTALSRLTRLFSRGLVKFEISYGNWSSGSKMSEVV